MNSTQERYWRRVEAGVCTLCGERPPVHGRRNCLPCSAASAAVQRANYEALRAKGICGYCRKRKSRKGTVTCAVCWRKTWRRRLHKHEAVCAMG